MNILSLGDDLLPGTDRRTGGRTEKRSNLKVIYCHFVNAVTLVEYPPCQGVRSKTSLHCSLKDQIQTT